MELNETPSENNGIQLNQLPDEIIEFILTYLPPYQDLENCSLVCKRWNAIVKNLIRRSKKNLHKGLLDFRLRWEVFTEQTKSEKRNNHVVPIPTIAGRFSHSAVRHGNSMYVFGGGSSSDTTFNDLWRFDLSEMRWERPVSMGSSYPSPKGSASLVSWRNQLILFGGWRYPSLHPPYQPWCLFDELHFYDVELQQWSVRMLLPCPPPMAGHSASVHGNKMVVFGGYQIADGINSNSDETWCLDLNEYKWWQPRIAGSTKPQPRYGQFQMELDEKHLLIVGGCGGPNSVYSDAWVLDMSQDVWKWRTIPVRNKKYGATHMWCNPACKIDSKLVVLGPTPNLPQDFQLMRQTRVPVGGGLPAPRQLANGVGAGQNNPNDQRNGGFANNGGNLGLRAPNNHNRPGAGGPYAGPNDQYYANRRAILNQHQQNANNNLLNSINNYNNNNNNSNNNNNNNNNNSNNNNNNLQPRTGRLRDLHATASNEAAATEERNHNRPSTSTAASRVNGSSPSSSISSGLMSPRSDNDINQSNGQDIEAANRLQRNLALRCRDNEPLLPKRFDELYEDPIRMAAFKDQNSSRSWSRDHTERIRRLEEKMNAIRNSRRNIMLEQKSIKEPSPKRVKRNVLSLFVCDLSAALHTEDPHLQWLEYKNYGIIPGAPERHILSTMVAGHGELILFGGVHKETLSEITHQVSNTVHFLSAPRDIV